MTKILLIDDDQGTTHLIEMVLQKAGYQVTCLHDSTQALEVVKQDVPNLILLDQMMPGLDGVSVARQLKANPKLAKIPIIFFTALGDIKIKSAAFDAGVRDYITKPVHPQELLLRIKTLLG